MKWIKFGLLALLGGLASLQCGCTSLVMKGSPLYTTGLPETGEVGKDRVNLWPAFYYRDRACSILWPLGEKTDDHFALRPLMSVYGLDEAEQEYNVLWPLCQFDFKHDRHRVVPFFWGRHYACAFPLYWHTGDMSSQEGAVDTLLPLWWYWADADEYDFWLGGPFIRMMYREHTRGWHILPLIGSYDDGNDYYRFALWPLVHWWSQYDGRERGSCALPLYFASRNGVGTRFFSLLYSGGCNAKGDESWNTLLPLFYSNRKPESHTFATLLGGMKTTPSGSTWVAVPLLAGGQYNGRYGEAWFGGFLGHAGWGPERASSHLLPLYYYSRSGDDSLFLSIPWSSRSSPDRSWQYIPPLFYHGRDAESETWLSPLYMQGGNAELKEKWNALIPLFYSSRDPDSSTFVTLLGGRKTSPSGSTWVAVPLLAGGQRSGEYGEAWFGGFLGHAGSGPERASSHFLPLYYYSRDADDSLFVSLPWSSRSSPNRSWQVIPPLVYHGRDTESESWITPLYMQSTNSRTKESQSLLLPLYYREANEDSSMLATLLGGWRRDATGHGWLIYPLLSWYGQNGDTRDLWLGAPFFHSRSVKGDLTHQHLLPLYYYSRDAHLFLSPLAGRWKDEDGTVSTLIPPLLAYGNSSTKVRNLWALGGLAHFSGGPEARSEHIIPLYYRDKKTGAFVSIPYASWKDDDTRYSVLPPLLSWAVSRPDSTDLWMVGPLAHFSWGEDAQSSHVFPLYYRNWRDDTFLSLPYCAWGDEKSRTHVIPPLLSAYKARGQNRDLTLLLGLGGQQWGPDVPSEGYLFPLYYYREDTDFISPLIGWHRSEHSGFFYPLTPLVGFRNGDYTGGWIFPIFSKRTNRKTGDYTGNVFWAFYEKDGWSSHSWMFPLFSYKRDGTLDEARKPGAKYGTYGKRFWCLPFGFYRNQVTVPRLPAPNGQQAQVPAAAPAVTYTKVSGYQPLWYYKRITTGSTENKAFYSLFLPFYAKRHWSDSRSVPHSESSVLWYLWHSDRSGDTVMTDLFPGISYDRDGSKYRKVSFLWRFFRYERSTEGKKVDLLFVPVWRTRS